MSHGTGAKVAPMRRISSPRETGIPVKTTKPVIQWNERIWTPLVGMMIRYRDGVNLASKAHPDTIAKIVSISDDLKLQIEKDRGVKKNVRLSRSTWMSDWEPVPEKKDTQDMVSTSMSFTEDDIRRIVREELASRANKVESALRSFLDELFDSV